MLYYRTRPFAENIGSFIPCWKYDLFETLVTIMEKMVLVPSDKYQKMLEAKSVKITTAPKPKKKDQMPYLPPGNRTVSLPTKRCRLWTPVSNSVSNVQTEDTSKRMKKWYKCNQSSIYPYLRTEIKTTSITSGQYSLSADDIFQLLVPNKLIVGLVSSAAYMGDYSKSRSTLNITTVVRWVSTSSMGSPIPLNLYSPIMRRISTWDVTGRWPHFGTTLTWIDTITSKIIVSTC